GRDFQPSDGPEAPTVAIVNQAFAKRFVGTDDPSGRIVRLPDDDPRESYTVTIVGLSADAVYRSIREVVPPTLIMPMAQQRTGSSTSTLNILAGGRIDGALLRGVTGAIGAIDPSISITFRAMDDLVSTALIRERLVAMLSAFFG